MRSEQKILRNLKADGYRLTRVRKTLVDSLSKTHTPLSMPDLKMSLSEQGVPCDRTTIYREILFLKKRGVICEIPFGRGRKGYKACQDTHHHHLICVRCNKVEEIVLKKTLVQQENEISQRRDFKVLDHLLEFYGLCGDCQ